MAANHIASLPPHGVPMSIPEIILKGIEMDGKSVRVVGRIDYYDPIKCTALLSEPNKPAAEIASKKLSVDTRLTDELDCRLNSQVMLIGELEKLNYDVDDSNEVTQMGGGNIILKARVSRCVDRMDYTLYCKSLQVWRKFDSVGS